MPLTNSSALRGREGLASGNVPYASERRMKLAWKAYCAELVAMQMAEHPSEVVVAERVREYLRNRLAEATRVLYADSSALAELLIEILEIATGEAEK
jgi:hypothetical protein